MTLLQLRAHSGLGGVAGRSPLWARVFSNEIFTACVGAAFVVLVPAIINFRDLSLRSPMPLVGNSIPEQLVAFLVGVLVLGRLTAHPGVLGIRFVIPVLTVTYGAAVAVEFFTRDSYSGQQILVSYLLALGWFYATYAVKRRWGHREIAVVPLGRIEGINNIRGADWAVLEKPDNLQGRHFDAVVADLHADLGSDWEAFLARTALSGVPIYHATQVCEAMTGRTQIEHLSENVIGSLVPNTIYAKVKAFIDVGTAVVALIVLAPLFVAISLLIALDSPGSPLFTQKRMGYRGRLFTIYKFRTMFADHCEGRSFTSERDPRITKVGAVLRRYHLDELPQIINVIRGEMSWIGPRPEAEALNDWYEREIPFFCYRHIVRPGISGWAQVQQGYAAEVTDVRDKLHYDFYYIKNFSLWLDVLIVIKTFGAFISGRGAR